MNNEEKFDITKVRFGGYLRGLKVGSEGFFAQSLAELYHKVCGGKTDYGKLKKIDKTEASFVRDGDIYRECNYLYFYLVKEPKEKQYRPFTWEDREYLRGKWIRRKDSSDEEESIGEFYMSSSDTFKINLKSARELLDSWEFLDGLPCGVEITEEE